MGASSWAPCPRVGPWHTAEAVLLLGVADTAGTRGASDRGCCEGASEKREPGPNGRSRQLGYGPCRALLCVHCFLLTSEQRGTLLGTRAPLLRFVLSVAAVAQAERWSRRAVEMRGEEGSWLLHRLPLPMQQEVENFKKVNMISREQFDTLTPEPPVDPNQEVPPGPPRFQQGKRQRDRNK